MKEQERQVESSKESSWMQKTGKTAKQEFDKLGAHKCRKQKRLRQKSISCKPVKRMQERCKPVNMQRQYDELKRAQKNKADVETLQKDTDDRKIKCETEINTLSQSLKACEEKIITEQNSLYSLEKKIMTIKGMLQEEWVSQPEREYLEAQLADTQASRDASQNQLDAYM